MKILHSKLCKLTTDYRFDYADRGVLFVRLASVQMNA